MKFFFVVHLWKGEHVKDFKLNLKPAGATRAIAAPHIGPSFQKTREVITAIIPEEASTVHMQGAGELVGE